MNEEPPAQEVLVQKSNARRVSRASANVKLSAQEVLFQKSNARRESRASANVKLSAKPSPRKSPAKKRR
jgi:hypothetical protein